MSKDAVSDWDTTPDNNTDIAGIDIAEGCPARGINNAIRTLMAQIKAWSGTILTAAGGVMTGALTALGNGSTIKDAGGTEQLLGYRGIPQNVQTAAYTIALADVGRHIFMSSGNVTIPANATTAFVIGDAVTIVNNSGSSRTIAPASGVTLRQAGASSTGNRTLAQRGIATAIKVATDEWYIAGAGLS